MKALLSLIESPGFAAATGIASDLRTMIKLASARPVGEILRYAAQPRHQLTLAKRIASLGEQDIDVRYQNPADTAVAVYLWILSVVNPAFAKAAAPAALALRNGWWSHRMAREVFASGSGAQNSSATAVWTQAQSANFVRGGGGAQQGDMQIEASGVARHLNEYSSLATDTTTRSALSATSPAEVIRSGVSFALASPGSQTTQTDTLDLAA